MSAVTSNDGDNISRDRKIVRADVRRIVVEQLANELRCEDDSRGECSSGGTGRSFVVEFLRRISP